MGIGIIKKTTFLFVFLSYLHVFLLKFQSGEIPRCEMKFYIQRVPNFHTFDELCYSKNKKYLKKCDDDSIITCFSSISYFWGIWVCQKYVVWVLIGCGIKFHIQWALLLEIWVKTQRDMSKIRTNKVEIGRASCRERVSDTV